MYRFHTHLLLRCLAIACLSALGTTTLHAQVIDCPPGTVPITDGLSLDDPLGTPYRWIVRADAIFLDRSTADDDPPLAFISTADPKGTEILNPSGLDFSTRWGTRLSAIRCLNDLTSIEFGYFGIDSWETTTSRSGNIFGQFPSFAHPSLPTGNVTFAYSSALHSAEANLRGLSTSPWLTWIFGFRYLELSEDFGGVFTTAGGASAYAIDTNNHLAGFQIGGEAHLWQQGAWSVDGWLKAAILSNSADQSTMENARALAPGGGTLTAGARGDKTAFFGEIGLTAIFQVSQYLGLRAGYQAMWLDRVALAPEQLDNTNPMAGIATLDQSGDVFYHGGFFGLEGLF